MESDPCSQILAPYFQVVSCQEEGLGGQAPQVRDCTWGAADVYQEDSATVACNWSEHKSCVFPQPQNPQSAST